MGPTYRRGHDFGGNAKVPDRGATTCSEFGHELRNIFEFREGLSLEPESARDAREVAIAEHRTTLWHPLCAQLVQLGAVGTVVHHDDQDVKAMALDGFELLHVHHQATVTVEQDNLSIGSRRRDSHGERDAVADRAELADGEKPLLWTRRHLGEEDRKSVV